MSRKLNSILIIICILVLGFSLGTIYEKTKWKANAEINPNWCSDKFKMSADVDSSMYIGGYKVMNWMDYDGLMTEMHLIYAKRGLCDIINKGGEK